MTDQYPALRGQLELANRRVDRLEHEHHAMAKTLLAAQSAATAQGMRCKRLSDAILLYQQLPGAGDVKPGLKAGDMQVDKPRKPNADSL